LPATYEGSRNRRGGFVAECALNGHYCRYPERFRSRDAFADERWWRCMTGVGLCRSLTFIRFQARLHAIASVVSEPRASTAVLDDLANMARTFLTLISTSSRNDGTNGPLRGHSSFERSHQFTCLIPNKVRASWSSSQPSFSSASKSLQQKGCNKKCKSHHISGHDIIEP
jgi:hypothetical protein